MIIDVYILHYESYYHFDVYEFIESNGSVQSKYLLSEWYLDLNEDDELNSVSPNQHLIRYLEELLCCSCFKNSQIRVTVVNTNGLDLCTIPSKPGYYSTSMVPLAQYLELNLQKPTDVTQVLIRSDFQNNQGSPTRLHLSVGSGAKRCSLFHEKDLMPCNKMIEIKGNSRTFMSLTFYNEQEVIGRIDLDASMDYYIHLHSAEKNNKQLADLKLYDSQFSLVATLRYEEGASLLTCDTLPVFHTRQSYRSNSSSIRLLDPICSIPGERTEITIQRVRGDDYQSMTINDQGEIQTFQSFNSRTITGKINKHINIRGQPFLLRVDLPQLSGLLTLRPRYMPSIRFMGKVTDWKNGCATGRLYINSVLLFEGSLKHWKMDGECTKYYMNGRKEFEGSFVKNVPHGNCRQYSFSDQETPSLMYDGSFVNGLKDGEGKLMNMNGDEVYSGKWKKDQINEEGLLTLQDIRGDCEYYVGEAVDQIARMESGIETSVPSNNLKGKQIWCKKLISGMIVEMDYVREYELKDEDTVTPISVPDQRDGEQAILPYSTKIKYPNGRNSLDPSDSPSEKKDSISVVTKCPSSITIRSNT